MAAIRQLWEFMFSPTLYRVYNDGRPQGMYIPNSFEKFGDQVINSLLVMWNVGLYSSPLIATFFYKKGYFVFESLALVTKVLIGIGVILSSSYCIRGLGRLNNPTYISFYEVLVAAKKSLNKDTKKALCKYDFDFSDWPVDFRWSDVEIHDGHSRFYVDRPPTRGSVYDTILSLPCRVLSFLAAHTFGIKMVYPGSIRALQYFTCMLTFRRGLEYNFENHRLYLSYLKNTILVNYVLENRGKLITDFGAERCKLRTRDGNDIDSIFIDRRGKFSSGDTLVICCEGNAGFYEFGISMTPIKANYSVLAWNHPGFGGSTGTPFPRQEQNAVDCVLQFAIHFLKFEPENIILFGWSIGGYTASWAAMNYPDIKGMILDATFDDILPLALPRMPASWEPLVRRTIRDYINLNVYEQLSKYNGPVTFIRRTEDEIICTEQGNLSTNRGNHLVSKFLRYRYPKLIDERRQNLLNEWLASDSLQQSLMWDRNQVDRDQCSALMNSYVSDNSITYPMQIGEEYSEQLKNDMVLFLVDAYLKNFRSTHCSALPVSLFRIPWSPASNDSSFVKL